MHTKEPWEVIPHSPSDNLDIWHGPVHIAVVRRFGNGHQQETDANAARIVSCVNVLAGLNPDAIKDLVQVAEDCLECVKETGQLATVYLQKLELALAALKGK